MAIAVIPRRNVHALSHHAATVTVVVFTLFHKCCLNTSLNHPMALLFLLSLDKYRHSYNSAVFKYNFKDYCFMLFYS